MGMGWKHVSGGIYSTGTCKKCHNGKVTIRVSDYEESDFSMELRGATFTGSSDCRCENFEKMSQHDLEYYN